MPDSVADQQKLIDLLPYITYKASGIGKKPTLVFTGLNVQISKKEYPGYGNVDGTGNLVIGDSGMRYSDQTVTDNRYSGSENLIVGDGEPVARAGERDLRGEQPRRQHRQPGPRAEQHRQRLPGLRHGQLHAPSPTAYRVIADGSGADVKWARYDATGKLVDSNEPMNVGTATRTARRTTGSRAGTASTPPSAP